MPRRRSPDLGRESRPIDKVFRLVGDFHGLHARFKDRAARFPLRAAIAGSLSLQRAIPVLFLRHRSETNLWRWAQVPLHAGRESCVGDSFAPAVARPRFAAVPLGARGGARRRVAAMLVVTPRDRCPEAGEPLALVTQDTSPRERSRACSLLTTKRELQREGGGAARTCHRRHAAFHQTVNACSLRSTVAPKMSIAPSTSVRP